MNPRKLKLSAVLILSIGLTHLYAQEAISSIGGNISGSGGSLSYSVGQTFYTSNTGVDGSVIQGVQQPYEIFIITGVSEIAGINLFVSTYPNPTNNFIKLLIETENLENFNYKLYDAMGNLMEYGIVESKEIYISMSNRMAATYILKVMKGTKEVKTFKIIKN